MNTTSASVKSVNPWQSVIQTLPSQGLSGRVKELAERYAAPLLQLDADVDVLSAKVEAHLERMGFA
jgi:hypothetical protein